MVDWALGGGWSNDRFHLMNQVIRLGVTNRSGAPKEREHSIVDALGIQSPTGKVVFNEETVFSRLVSLSCSSSGVY